MPITFYLFNCLFFQRRKIRILKLGEIHPDTRSLDFGSFPEVRLGDIHLICHTRDEGQGGGV